MHGEAKTEKDRIYLTSKSYLSRIRLACIIMGVLVVHSVGLILQLSGITFTTLGLSAGILMLSSIIIFSIYRNSSSACIKSDNLILKSFGNNHQLVPINCLREIKSFRLAKYDMIRVRYKLDGKKSSFAIISTVKNDVPSDVLRTILIDFKKRKKETNRKPGSVLTQTA